MMRTSGGTPPITSGYPLDDDGTVAAMFGQGSILATAPDYHQATYTYISPSSPSDNFTLPTLAHLFGSNYLPISGIIRGMEFEITTQPIAAFDPVALYAIFWSSPGTAVGAEYIGVMNVDGLTPTYTLTGPTGSLPRTTTANIHVAMILDGVNNNLYLVTSEGQNYLGTVPSGAVAVSFVWIARDIGLASAGNTVNATLLPNASQMSSLYPTGCVDYAGVACPVNGAWTPPVRPTPVSAATNVGGTNLTLTLSEGVTGGISPGGFTFSKNGNPITMNGATQPTSDTIQWSFTPSFVNGDVITVSFDGIGIMSISTGSGMIAFSNFAVVNNVP